MVSQHHPDQFNRHLTKGRWPEKSVKFITRLLKNAESNADAKNIELEDLYIKSIVVQQAPVRFSAISVTMAHSLGLL